MSILFSSYQLNKFITLKNRLVVSPMCQYSAVDGIANDWHLVHLGSRAVGGAAAVMQEATAVLPEGRISYADLGIWDDKHIPPLKRITDFIKQHHSVPGIQLAHAGRKASTDLPWEGGAPIAPDKDNGWQPVAPSPIAYDERYTTPAELTKDEIKQIVNAFAQAAKRAVEAGYEIIEIHAAHGYLLNEFLSPLSNFRTDEYGGLFENRIRILIEVIDACKPILTKQSLWVRISAVDWVKDGWNIQDSVHLANLLHQKGVEMMDVSSGGLVPHQQIKLEKNYQVPFAEAVKQAGIATAAVGLITDAHQAEDILQKQQADLILMGREFLRDPYFALHAAHALNEDISGPAQYARAHPHRTK